jgi:glycosyltransferase involved in cell wall biosynthesis
MRVLLLTTSFPANVNDTAGPFILRLVEALEEVGVRCHVLTPDTIRATAWSGSFKIDRFRYAPRKLQVLAQQSGGISAALNKNRFLFGLIPPFLFNMALQLCRIAPSVDVIHAHWSICGAVAVLTQWIHRRPVILTLHGSDHHRGRGRGVYAWLHRKALKGAAYTVCVSETMLAELQQQEKVRNRNNFCFIPNGVSDVFFNVRPRSRPLTDPLRFLVIGSLIPLKGVDTILKALSRLGPKDNWQLTVLGDGPERAKLQQFAQESNMGDFIDFLGSVSPNRMHDYMANHHVLIQASYREGRPSVVLEAMATAMAVIATDIDGTRELVKDGETGWLFPPDDDIALVRLFRDIFDGRKNIEVVGLAGRNWMKENQLTWKQTALRYSSIYKKVI